MRADDPVEASAQLVVAVADAHPNVERELEAARLAGGGDRDDRERHRAYAARWGEPDPRWRLLAADARTVVAVARALGESVVQRDRDGPILHSDHSR